MGVGVSVTPQSFKSFCVMDKALSDELSCMLTGLFTVRNNFCDYLFASLRKKPFGKGFLLTLLHSEWPKRYGVLAILSAIGLKERICSKVKGKYVLLHVSGVKSQISLS